jgi:hypothetical protein
MEDRRNYVSKSSFASRFLVVLVQIASCEKKCFVPIFRILLRDVRTTKSTRTELERSTFANQTPNEKLQQRNKESLKYYSNKPYSINGFYNSNTKFNQTPQEGEERLMFSFVNGIKKIKGGNKTLSRWMSTTPTVTTKRMTTTPLQQQQKQAAAVVTALPTKYVMTRGMSSTQQQQLSPTSRKVDLSLEQLTSTIAGGQYVRLLNQDNPHLDVVQYTHKNVFYNAKHIDYHTEALAIGIMEHGFIPGDVVLSYLPDHLCETVRDKYFVDCLICEKIFPSSVFVSCCVTTI